MTQGNGGVELVELGIPITSQTPLAHIVAKLRAQGYTDLGVMKVMAARYRDQARARALSGRVNETPEPITDAVPPAPIAGESPGAAPVTAPGSAPRPRDADVRAWARGLGRDVPSRGRLSPELVEEYLASLVPFEGGAPIPAEPKG